MKTFLRLFTLIVIALALLAAPVAVHAQDGGDGKVVMGGSYRLRSGETLNGPLAVFGGEATIEQGARVNGDVAVMGGTLTIHGNINGSVAVMGGTIFLSSTAVVEGDIRTLGGTVNQDPGAQIKGTVSSGPSDFNFNLPRIVPRSIDNIVTPIWQLMLSILQAFVMAAVAVLVVMFAPKPTERVAASVTAQPLVTGAIGLLTLILAPVVIVIVAITIIGIPISLLALLALAIAGAFGWIALGLELGQRMGVSLFHTNWTAPVAAGIGTLVLSLISGVASIIPCVGWVVPFVVAMLGLGGVLASKFGTQVYTRPTSAAIAPVTYPSAAPAAYTSPAPPQTPAPYEPPAETPAGAQAYDAPGSEPLPDADGSLPPEPPQENA